MTNLIKKVAPVIVIAALLFLFLVTVTRPQTPSPEVVATGGPYTLEKSIVAGGGHPMIEAGLDQHGTAGQAAAGLKSAAGQYSIYSGFWTPEQFVPTAAEVTISGHVRTPDGSGIRNVTLTLTSPDGSSRNVQTGSMGYYLFSGVMSGETYILTLTAKRYRFQQVMQVLNVENDLFEVDFVSN